MFLSKIQLNSTHTHFNSSSFQLHFSHTFHTLLVKYLNRNVQNYFLTLYFYTQFNSTSTHTLQLTLTHHTQHTLTSNRLSFCQKSNSTSRQHHISLTFHTHFTHISHTFQVQLHVNTHSHTFHIHFTHISHTNLRDCHCNNSKHKRLYLGKILNCNKTSNSHQNTILYSSLQKNIELHFLHGENIEL